MEQVIKDEIFEYLDSIFPKISTKEELENTFTDKMNIWYSTEDEEWKCLDIFHEYSNEMFSTDGKKIKSVGERWGK